MDILNTLLGWPDVVAGPPATPAELDDFQRQSGLSLPDVVREIYLASNGIVIRAGALEVLSLGRAFDYWEGLRNFGIPQCWGYMPLVDNFDSNPWCVCCAEPLTGYVVRIAHDESATIMFRSPTNFFAAINNLHRAGGWCLDEIPHDYADSRRLPQDSETADRLMEAASKLDDVERTDAYRFAISLYSENEWQRIAALLDDRDEYAREAAANRLKAMTASGARQALEAYRASIVDFVDRCAARLREAGIDATVHGDSQLRLNPGPIGLNTEMLYSRRNEPDFVEALIIRSRERLQNS